LITLNRLSISYNFNRATFRTLAIILTNAQAAQRLLAQQPPDLAEARDILADIISEDQSSTTNYRSPQMERRITRTSDWNQRRFGMYAKSSSNLNRLAARLLESAQGR